MQRGNAQSYPDLKRICSVNTIEEHDEGEDEMNTNLPSKRRSSLAMTENSYSDLYNAPLSYQMSRPIPLTYGSDANLKHFISYDRHGHAVLGSTGKSMAEVENQLVDEMATSSSTASEHSSDGLRMRGPKRAILGGARTSSRQAAVPPPSSQRVNTMSDSDSDFMSLRKAPGSGVIAFPDDSKKSALGYLCENVVGPTLEVAWDVNGYWMRRVVSALVPAQVKVQLLRQHMNAATSYAEWYKRAMDLDILEGKQAWKMEFESDLYDNQLIEKRLEDLRIARAKRAYDVREMMYLLRSGLFRNLGNMLNPKLFSHCNVGTKRLIEKYNDEVVLQLTQLQDMDIEGAPLEARMDFIRETRQAFGRTALCMSGGATMGCYHTGVVLALLKHKLLPRVITGSSAGAIIAAVICSTPDKLLYKKISSPIRMDAFAEDEGCEYPLLRKLRRLFEEGMLAPTETLLAAVKSHIGNVTFQESYNLTRRIVNISVCSENEHGDPHLLNYLTAPNVVVWSAVAASSAAPFLFAPVELMAKDKNGDIVKWDLSGDSWSDGSVQSDIPMTRLASMFNVNHFIVSQVNPHIVPFVHQNLPVMTARRWFPRMYELVSGELHYRLSQAAQMGIYGAGFAHDIINQKYQGNITIVPDIDYVDYLKILDNPEAEWMAKCATIAERSTWPYLGMIRVSCEIEMSLDRTYLALQEQMFESTRKRISADSAELVSRRSKDDPYRRSMK